MKSDKDDFKELLGLKETPEPSHELDWQIMNRIENIANAGPSNRHLLYLSWAFFAFGLLIGIAISIFWIPAEINIMGLTARHLPMIILTICTGLLLLLFDNIYGTLKAMRHKH
ncbi:hypothetical protein [Marinoscillum sp. MHG1-6]|uniref:hypothetical protein n=1 Tax=Marinoscillum sp. MHG1-6 TaxID=2959627 RepID=UPI0021575495|nr:hypothetical protein [Marinoscillum sp. MHG1-6]